MQENNKNEMAYRLREKERGRLRSVKQREAKLLQINEIIALQN